MFNFNSTVNGKIDHKIKVEGFKFGCDQLYQSLSDISDMM